MDERQETIADIVAEMRGLVKPGETLNHTYELLNGLADRIDAAVKRECIEVATRAATQGVNLTNEKYANRNCDRFGTDNAEASLAYEEFCDRAEVEESVNGAIAWLLSLDTDRKGGAK